MATLVYRTTGRKVKENLTTAEQMKRVLISMGMSPKQAANEVRWQQMKMQLAKLNP